jgi:twitching motility protein PilT
MSPSATRDEAARRFAEALVAGGYAGREAVASILAEASSTGRSFTSLLVSRGVVTADVALGVQSQLTQLPVLDLHAHHPATYALTVAPVAVVREFGAIGFELQGDRLVMAFCDPPDSEDLRTLSVLVGHEILPVLADPRAVEALWKEKPPPHPAEPAGPDAPAPVPVELDGTGTEVLAGVAAPAPSASTTAAAATAPAPPMAPAVPPVPAPQAPGAANGAAPGVANGAAPGAANGAAPGVASAAGAAQFAAGTGPERSGTGDVPLHLDDLLRYAVSVGASDLHLTSMMPACIRLHGAIRVVEGSPTLDNETIRNMVFGVLPQSLRERFEAEKELDTSHSVAGVGRFRLNVFMQRGTVAAALRAIPHEIPAFESLGVPESVRGFAELRRGLVLVTGPTGSGKSTTLASLVDIVNRSKPLHIVTIEDPIEFLHNHKRCIVNQREVGQDTSSFSEALRRVLREDPDVILVGEMRDLETIAMALTAAETGHLVFATLHTQDAPQTIDRIVDVFPTNQQEQVRTMLAAALEGVVTQQLIPNAEGTGRVAACEVMICTAAVRNLIRSNKTHQIYSLMQTGGQYGMQTMDQALAKLVREGVISEAVAFDRSRNEEDLRNHLAS